MHHAGSPPGPGIVRDSEEVVMGVFSSTVLNGTNLCADSFPTKQIKKSELSLSRKNYTSLADFTAHVVAPKLATGDTPIGVTVCLTKTLRDMTVPIPGRTPPSVRAVCVLDWVLPHEHNGHAALAFCDEDHNTLSQGQMGRIRGIIAIELAKIFSPIVATSSVLP